MAENKGGAPKGLPKGQINGIATQIKKSLPEAHETILEAVSFPKNKKALDKKYKKALRDFRSRGSHLFDVSDVRAELDSLWERERIEKSDYDKRIEEEELIKTAYKAELASITPDRDAVADSKWLIEKAVHTIIQSTTEVKNKLSNKKLLSEVNKELGITLTSEDDVGDSDEDQQSRLSVVRLKV